MMFANSALFIMAAFFIPGMLPGAHAAAVRGGDDDMIIKADRKLQGGAPGAVVEDHGGWKPYSTGSCTCAKDAYLAINEAVFAELKMVPLTSGAGGVDDPGDIYSTIQFYVGQLVDFAVCALHRIDCGCDDAPYGQQPFQIFNAYKVSTYQCCCDVNAMRDVIIEAIKQITTSWRLTYKMGGGGDMVAVVDDSSVAKRHKFHVYEDAVTRAVESIRKIGEVYSIPACEDALGCRAGFLVEDDMKDTLTDFWYVDGNGVTTNSDGTTLAAPNNNYVGFQDSDPDWTKWAFKKPFELSFYIDSKTIGRWHATLTQVSEDCSTRIVKDGWGWGLWGGQTTATGPLIPKAYHDLAGDSGYFRIKVDASGNLSIQKDDNDNGKFTSVSELLTPHIYDMDMESVNSDLPFHFYWGQSSPPGKYLVRDFKLKTAQELVKCDPTSTYVPKPLFECIE